MKRRYTKIFSYMQYLIRFSNGGSVDKKVVQSEL